MTYSHKKVNKISALAFVIGGLSFIPLVGVLFGFLSIIWGLTSKKDGHKLVILLGSLGIVLTIVLYGSIYLFSNFSKDSAFNEAKMLGTKNNMTSLVQSIEFYKVQNGKYPLTLEELSSSLTPQGIYVNTVGFLNSQKQDRSESEYYYALTDDRSGYYLRSVGLDGEPFTSDDILPDIDPKNLGLIFDPGSESAH